MSTRRPTLQEAARQRVAKQRAFKMHAVGEGSR
jgi:hypothetical protein